jgi:hypothetical protein
LYPLRLVAVFGMIVMTVSFIYGLFALLWQLLGGHTVEGWTSLMICMHFLGGCQLAALGIISEYLGRTLDQVKGRPLYILRSACGFAQSNLDERGAVPSPHFSLSAARHSAASSRPEQREVNATED